MLYTIPSRPVLLLSGEKATTVEFYSSTKVSYLSIQSEASKYSGKLGKVEWINLSQTPLSYQQLTS